MIIESIKKKEKEMKKTQSNGGENTMKLKDSSKIRGNIQKLGI